MESQWLLVASRPMGMGTVGWEPQVTCPGRILLQGCPLLLWRLGQAATLGLIPRDVLRDNSGFSSKLSASPFLWETGGAG